MQTHNNTGRRSRLTGVVAASAFACGLIAAMPVAASAQQGAKQGAQAAAQSGVQVDAR
jgi:hypothetical protein